MGAIQALGYVGIDASDLAAWRELAAGVVGFEVQDHDDGALCLRMDERALRIVVQNGASDDVAFAGWEVADEQVLENVAGQLAARGLEVHWGSAEQAAYRRVTRYLRFDDPNGMATEIFCGPRMASSPFRSPCDVSGFAAGELGLGQIELACADPARLEQFYTQTLGFRVTDYVDAPSVEAVHRRTFLRVNARHHSLAIGAADGAGKRLRRLTVELASIDDLGTTYDRTKGAGAAIVATLGRNVNDRLCSFRVATPFGFVLEIGHGALRIDDDSVWEPVTHDSASVWGHRPPERSEIRQGWERAAKLAALKRPVSEQSG